MPVFAKLQRNQPQRDSQHDMNNHKRMAVRFEEESSEPGTAWQAAYK
jgi:hypothetical protein